MADIPSNVKSLIQYGKDTYTNWTKVNPVLMEGEVVIVYMDSARTQKRMKIGDGITAFNSLPWREPQVADSLGTSTILAPSQRAINEGMERVEEILSLFNYQTRT